MYNPASWVKFVEKSDEELKRLSRTDLFRGSGRGGQKRNKTSNAVRLTLEHLSVTECGSRSKSSNLDSAARKLRMAIALDTKDCLRFRNQFNGLPQEMANYSRGGLIRINPKNPQFPKYLGYLIDAYIHFKGDWKLIAEEYGVSNSQLGKFVRKSGVLQEKLKEIQLLLTAAPSENVNNSQDTSES